MKLTPESYADFTMSMVIVWKLSPNQTEEMREIIRLFETIETKRKAHPQLAGIQEMIDLWKSWLADEIVAGLSASRKPPSSMEEAKQNVLGAINNSIEIIQDPKNYREAIELAMLLGWLKWDEDLKRKAVLAGFKDVPLN